MTLRYLLSFFVIELLFVVMGVLFGIVVDQILVTISYDYVYSPDRFRAEGWIWGLALGAFAGLFIAEKPAISVRLMTISFSLGVVTTLFIAFATALAFFGVEKCFPTASESLVFTSPRHQFCRGLVWGSGIGSVLGTIVFINTLKMNTQKRRTKSVISSRSESDPESSESGS